MPAPIYQISHIQESEGLLTSTVRIDRGHALFQGHFPGAPVTPGVVEIGMVRNILQQYFNKKLSMKSLRSCKFLEILNPVTTPEIEVQIRFRQDELLEVTASASAGSATFFKLQAAYM